MSQPGPEGWILPLTSFRFSLVQNIKRDPFEQAVGSQQKTAMSLGGALGPPATAFQYDWNMLPIGQQLWLKESRWEVIPKNSRRAPESYNLSQLIEAEGLRSAHANHPIRLVLGTGRRHRPLPVDDPKMGRSLFFSSLLRSRSASSAGCARPPVSSHVFLTDRLPVSEATMKAEMLPHSCIDHRGFTLNMGGAANAIRAAPVNHLRPCNRRRRRAARCPRGMMVRRSRRSSTSSSDHRSWPARTLSLQKTVSLRSTRTARCGSSIRSTPSSCSASIGFRQWSWRKPSSEAEHRAVQDGAVGKPRGDRQAIGARPRGNPVATLTRDAGRAVSKPKRRHGSPPPSTPAGTGLTPTSSISR